MNEERRFLCVCQWGHSRSVAAARAFHYAGKAAVACGWMTAGNGLQVLCDWATDIILMDKAFIQYIPLLDLDKITNFHVGDDIWSNPYHPELFGIVKAMVESKFGFKVNA